MPAKTLYEYYTSQGKSLSSVAERAKLYGDPNYTGTAEQNAVQLAKLQNTTPLSTTQQQVPSAVSVAPTTTPRITPAATPVQPTQTLTPTATRYTLPTSDTIQTDIASKQAELEAQKEKQRVALMDTINRKYDTQSKELMAQQRAINYNKGQIGAETGNAAKNRVSETVEGNRASEIQTALTNLDNVFYERERNVISDAYAKAQYDVNIYDKLKAQEDADKKTVLASLATLGKAGNTIEDIKQDTVLYDNMKKTGLSDIEIMATLNENSARPTDFQLIGNKIVGTYFDPKTNAIKTITQDLGFELPENPDNVIITKLGDDMVIYDKAKKQIVETIKGQPTALEQSQIAENYAQAKKLSGGGVMTGGGGVISDDPFVQSLLNTQGGKPLTDTSIQKLDKGLTVLGQLGVLQANVENVKTGPIVGAFRSKNPWDTQAQTIKTSLNAIVPNLARGVYGEVGVLTDNDIATYSKTIPNLQSTEEVRNAVLYITLDMIGKSIKNTLSVNAAAGRDVSGFTDIYTEMENTKNNILSTIPGAQVPVAFQQGEKITKGTMSNQEFRKKALAGISSEEYNTFAQSAPEGTYPVIDNATGQTGYIPIGEYDPLNQTRI